MENIRDIIENVDIVDYIGKFVLLEKRGDEYFGLSPFKEEKTPSFSVSREKRVFYDFSSGKSGNVFTFVKLFFKCTNSEAAKILKGYLVDGGLSVGQGSDSLSAVNVFKKFSKKGKRQEVFNKRYPESILDRFEYDAPELSLWRNEGIRDAAMRRFGVGYDRVLNRIVYPIRSVNGDILNIGFRTADRKWHDKGLAKYGYFYNWDAGIDVIYGLSENLERIKEKEYVIVFEGVKSVLKADKWNIKNTCAILTSHMNWRQVKLLAAMRKRIVFAFDKDADPVNDRNVQRLKNYANVEYLIDTENLLYEKDSPVDRGYKVFESLYRNRKRVE